LSVLDPCQGYRPFRCPSRSMVIFLNYEDRDADIHKVKCLVNRLNKMEVNI
jgi:hypothetical protein